MSLHPGTALSTQTSGHRPLQWHQPNTAHPLCAHGTLFLSLQGPSKTMRSPRKPLPLGVRSYSSSPFKRCLGGAISAPPHPPPRNSLPRANSSLPSGLTPSRPLPAPPPPLSPGLLVPGAPSWGKPEGKKEKEERGAIREQALRDPPRSV